MYWFGGVSLTAGFCEEFLFRGYFIWALAPWLGWWGAAALSLLIFASGHAYQGWNGALRTGIVGAIFTLVVAIFGSLWPAIALHALMISATECSRGWHSRRASERRRDGSRSAGRLVSRERIPGMRIALLLRSSFFVFFLTDSHGQR